MSALEQLYQQIILDHAWALDAVYSVFDRKTCYQPLKAQRGRFTRSLLAALVWRDHREPWLGAPRTRRLTVVFDSAGRVARYDFESDFPEDLAASDGRNNGQPLD